MKPIYKRLLSGVLSAVMTLSAVPIVSPKAEESTEPYPYTMFAASSEDGAITVIFDAFANCFAEREYLGYLNQGKWFIHKTDDSKNNTRNNIEILNNIISKYAGSDISIDKQLAV